MAALPYVTSPRNVEKALNGIKLAATPERVSQDLVKTILKIPGGSGSQMTTFLRKIGFTNADGTPSDIYRKFRNPSTSGVAVAEALKIGFKPLYVRNEYAHQLDDNKLKALLIEETGQSHDSNIVTMIFGCIKDMKKFASFNSSAHSEQATESVNISDAISDKPSSNINFPLPQSLSTDLGLNLSYTINLNLPATSDIAVFNAIFKSLKDNLLRS